MRRTGGAALAAGVVTLGLLECPSPPPPGKLPPPGDMQGLFPHRKTMNWFVAHDGELAAVVWTDGAVAGGSGGHVSGPESVVRAHVVTSFDGDHVEWECRTRPDGSGALSVGGQTYDLDDGRVFLIRTKKSPPRVVQLERDLRVVQLERDLRVVEATGDTPGRLADGDPEVSAFLKAAEEPDSWLDRLGS